MVHNISYTIYYMMQHLVYSTHSTHVTQYVVHTKQCIVHQHILYSISYIVCTYIYIYIYIYMSYYILCSISVYQHIYIYITIGTRHQAQQQIIYMDITYNFTSYKLTKALELQWFCRDSNSQMCFSRRSRKSKGLLLNHSS